LAICRVDLVAGQLAALAGLGALRHLDLDHVGVDQVFGGHAEAARGDLLDGRAHPGVAVGSGLKRSGSSPPSPVFDLPPMAFMAMRQRGVRLAADRAERHGAGGKPLDDLLAGSTSSSGTGSSAISRNLIEQAAQVISARSAR
jgi:hypothetical protein